MGDLFYGPGHGTLAPRTWALRHVQPFQFGLICLMPNFDACVLNPIDSFSRKPFITNLVLTRKLAYAIAHFTYLSSANTLF